MLSASVAALGTTGACANAEAASARAQASPQAKAPLSRKHGRRRHHRAPRPATPHHGPFVYKAQITEAVPGYSPSNPPNTACTPDGGARIARVSFEEIQEKFGHNAGPLGGLWEHPSVLARAYTLTLSPATRITIPWLPPKLRQEAREEAARNNGNIRDPHFQGQEDTTTIGTVCAAASQPNSPIADVGARTVVTWSLPAPVPSLAVLVAQPAASIKPNNYGTTFEILPDGSVPPFTPQDWQ
jgi:hypothetical protein